MAGVEDMSEKPDSEKPDHECSIAERPYRDFIMPTFLPLMKRPDRQVQKTNAEKEMRDLLKRTLLMLRGE
jgi:hypothetical protein